MKYNIAHILCLGLLLQPSILCASLIVLFFASPLVMADTYVQGHYRADGSFVEGYWRTKADRYQENNYSAPSSIPKVYDQGYHANPIYVPFQQTKPTVYYNGR